ncbi:hypothetical protein AC578_9318 [Pseudocercospora eumusae]|uniref:Uncharacterized protein n=1 Tax=Pseudocercospora eumusae TaxID=321146 RepID=A0A139HNE6_9PEZI|nr:hypothetical protein AC578_9318 [Pseudocercospora eumusae]
MPLSIICQPQTPAPSPAASVHLPSTPKHRRPSAPAHLRVPACIDQARPASLSASIPPQHLHFAALLAQPS